MTPDEELHLVLNTKLTSSRGGVASTKSSAMIFGFSELTEEEVKLSKTKADNFTKSESVINRIQSRHHKIAQLMAEGRKNSEIAIILGISQSRISLFKQDPAFMELVETYKTHSIQKFADMQQRLAQLGESAIEELQERIEENPKQLSPRELIEVAVMTLDRSIAPVKNGRNTPSDTNIQINVVNYSQKKDEAEETKNVLVIDQGDI